jgi:hypothetical protein
MKLRVSYDIIDDIGNPIELGFSNACQIDMRENRPFTKDEEVIMLFTIDRFLNRLTIHEQIGRLLFQAPGMGIGGEVEKETHKGIQRWYEVQFLNTQTISIDNNNPTLDEA